MSVYDMHALLEGLDSVPSAYHALAERKATMKASILNPAQQAEHMRYKALHDMCRKVLSLTALLGSTAIMDDLLHSWNGAAAS